MESYNMDDVGENPFSDRAASEQGEVNEDDGDMLATGSVRSNDTAASFDLEDDLADVAVDTPHSSLPHEGPESNVEQQDGMPSYSEDIMPKDSVLTGRALLYFTSIFVSIGVFLFGYDQGVMSGCLTGHYFRDHFHNPSRAAIGVMVSILEVGALCSSLMVSRLGEKWGRRRTIKYGSLVFVILVVSMYLAFIGTRKKRTRTPSIWR